jgi:hypothetical protein
MMKKIDAEILKLRERAHVIKKANMLQKAALIDQAVAGMIDLLEAMAAEIKTLKGANNAETN